tara:strand:- start:19783 stop:19902 length:120 start_codon:yes stop_codon:yes gene_type:complete
MDFWKNDGQRIFQSTLPLLRREYKYGISEKESIPIRWIF